MSRVEVLVATTKQVDLAIFTKMNIQTDVIIANQCDQNGFVEQYSNGCRVRMLSTNTKGVGINRNLAMQLSEAEICLLADDDLVYTDGYEQIVLKEFDENPQASIIGFSITEVGQKTQPRIYNHTKKTKHNFGAAVIAYRNSDIKKANISFIRLFGGGAKYSCGEDSLFCFDAKRKGLVIYQSKENLGSLNVGNSSWFHGYTDKYYYDKGAIYCALSNTFGGLYCIRQLFIHPEQYKRGNKTFWQALHLMNNGRMGYRRNLSYEEYGNIKLNQRVEK
jgi:glycosyltransferase involved in cell wall biosynthesis